MLPQNFLTIPQIQRERERQAQTQQTQEHFTDESGFEELRQQLVHLEMEIREKRAEEMRRSIRSRFRWLIVIALLAAAGYFLWPKLVALYKAEKGVPLSDTREALSRRDLTLKPSVK